jgi:hypothetical protein
LPGVIQDGRVVDEHVQTTELIVDVGEQAIDAVLISYIELVRNDGQALSRQHLCGRLSLLSIACAQNDAHASPSELMNDFQADAPIGTGYNRYFCVLRHR